jgi:hypothetical protein
MDTLKPSEPIRTLTATTIIQIKLPHQKNLVKQSAKFLIHHILSIRKAEVKKNGSGINKISADFC